MATRVATSALKQAISRSTARIASSSSSSSAVTKRSYMTAQALEQANHQEIMRYAAGGVAALVIANGFVIWTEVKDPENAHFRNAAAMQAKSSSQETDTEEPQTSETEQLLLHHEDEFSTLMRRSRHPVITLHFKM